MRYRITTPVRGFRGEVAGVAFADSKAEIDEQAHSRALAYFRRKGYRVEALEEAKGEPEPERSEQSEDRHGSSQRPAANAKKESLVAYAVAELGLTDEEANDKTRVELLDLIDKHEKESEQ
ncbi:hypothetical protein ABZW49_10350 [Nonomuraea wenchangensis]